ncbi:hypothetical protein [Nibrella viscosa]|uniref:hypothetical protein n=1 Tax=Nibrella viscosa TaxID=1084524 RepID=UPI00351A4EBE
MMLSRFSDAALTRSEMKRVVGGGTCSVCSARQDGSGGTCGAATFTYSEASSMASNFNNNPPESSGNYKYYVAPIGCS